MGRDESDSRSLPFLETMDIVDDNAGWRRSGRSLANWENIRLLWEDNLAYVDSPVNAIWAFNVVWVLLSD